MSQQGRDCVMGQHRWKVAHAQTKTIGHHGQVANDDPGSLENTILCYRKGLQAGRQTWLTTDRWVVHGASCLEKSLALCQSNRVQEASCIDGQSQLSSIS